MERENVFFYPLRLQASFHETLWGGRDLEGWKQLPDGTGAIGEAWETEISAIVQNGPFAGKTLGDLVNLLGDTLLGAQALSIFGKRFPLLAKFIDAHARLSVQVHPDDRYAAEHEGGKLGKTECWYILSAAPGASIVHGFKAATSREAVRQAIQDVTLEQLLHEEPVQAGDVIFVPAGTVHAIGAGILLYELQEYSDVTYRLYDYGRLTASGKPRELHIDRSLDVARYDVSRRVRVRPVLLAGEDSYEDRCLVACPYFIMHELRLKPSQNRPGSFTGRTSGSCVILSSTGAEARVYYGDSSDRSEAFLKGETVVLPAALGSYRIEGSGTLLLSSVPSPGDAGWRLWQEAQENS
ncbi:MAG: class I mannose-6-phosphate isomerase [Ktedonobacteraceae bacterium]|nr:class I mannose-6-phosphate isomerase [Ktedonobacteraceae bacterium]